MAGAHYQNATRKYLIAGYVTGLLQQQQQDLNLIPRLIKFPFYPLLSHLIINLIYNNIYCYICLRSYLFCHIPL